MKKVLSISAILLLVLTVSTLLVNAGSKTFKEKIFFPLKWGMSVDSFKSSYPRSDNIVQVISIDDSNKFYQDLNLPFYSHISVAGFRFGFNGLDHIIISYLFRTKDRELHQSDILKSSKLILQKLTQNYGKRTYNYPWNGQNFNYIWLKKATFIQFAWDGGDSWGIQFRSVELDPQVKKFLKDSQ